MAQKIIKIGSSAGVTIPQQALEDIGVSIGDEVRVGWSREERTLTVEPALKVDSELIDWTRTFIKKYKKAFDELKDK